MKTKQKQTVCAAAIITDGKGKLFLQKRYDTRYKDAHGKWEFPGGAVEMGETPEIAVVRECKEEMRCDVTIRRFLPRVQMNTWTHREGTIKYRRHVFVLVFECRIKKGIPKPQNKEVSELGWFTKSEAEKLKKLPRMEKFIELI